MNPSFFSNSSRNSRSVCRKFTAILGLIVSAAFVVSAQSQEPTPSSAGKIAARPLYRDPVYDHPTDPVVVYNAESKKWLMYYTQRRGGTIAQIHGTKIGIAASEDGGATWKYQGTADITYGQDQYPTNYTYWAPEVIWANGKYHMFLAFVPGIFDDWNHPREIGHLTSTDGFKWDTVGKIDLKSNKVIDPCVIQLTNGTWRMFYKDEARPHNVCYADSPDLDQWQTMGNAVTDRNGEGENCIRFQGKYWLLADTDRPVGQAVWSSDDCTHWTPQDSTIYGSHGDMVVSGGRAWWFYFGGQRVDHINWAVLPAADPAMDFTNTTASTDAPETAHSGRHSIAINVVELKVSNGKLMFTSPSQPTYIDLKPVREKKTDERRMRPPVQDRSALPFSSPPEVYSGISGPGQPVAGDGYGGYRTGRTGVMYRGTAPAKTGWQPLGDKARGTAISDGLIPPLRPLWDLHLRDTIIKLGPDGMYYLTGSSGDNIWDRNDGVELWRSADLQKWDYLGLVWSVDRDGTWQKHLRYVWAPEIHFISGKPVLALCMSGGPGGGTFLLKSTSGKPEGPYANPFDHDANTGGGIDATLFQDDDGKVYFSNGGGGAIRLLKPDLSGFDGASHRLEIEHPDDGTWRQGQVSLEGVSIFKHAGKYYLTGAAFYHGRYSSVATISTNIFGPYKQWHEAVPCGGGGNYFQAKDGYWYCTYFGNDDQSPWREKPGIVRIDFAPDGKIFIADEQPAFVLQPGAPEHWRPAAGSAKTPPHTL